MKKIKNTYEDWWAKHNLTSRISIFLFVLIYALTVGAMYYISIPLPIAQVLVQTTGYIAFLTIIIVILGPNTIVKIVDIYTENKFKNLEKEDQ